MSASRTDPSSPGPDVDGGAPGHLKSSVAEVQETTGLEHDDALAKRVVRKIDRRLMPLLFVTYCFNFVDKTILSSASVFGLPEDTHLKGQNYSWVSSVFYFGYLFWEYPTTLLVARLPVAKYLAANTLFWGAVVALTAACTEYGGLLTVRFLLGIAEATITPAFMFITSTWYTRDEIPKRTGVWFAGNSAGGLIGTLFAYGIGHVGGPLHPWRWMYIILGIATFLWGFVLLVFLPDSISGAAFLTLDERRFARDRVVVAGTGRTEKTVWKWDQVKECLVDPKTWLLVGVAVLNMLPNSGAQNFGNLVLKSFGFTSLQTTLLVIPASAIAVGAVTIGGWLAGRFRNATCLLIVAVVLPSIIGSALIYANPKTSSGVQLFGYFMLFTSPAALSLTISLIQANYKGVTKKMTMTALFFIAYCAGSIGGPQLFKASEAPHYTSAFEAILACLSLEVVLVLVLRTYMQWFNSRRDHAEGIRGSAGFGGAVGAGDVASIIEGNTVAKAVERSELQPEDYADVTDWHTVGFRYRL